MNPSENSSIPFKSKKPLLHPKAQNPKSNTPEKSPQPPRGSRNCSVALSIKEVRKVAESLHDSDCPDQSDCQPKSARRLIESWHPSLNLRNLRAAQSICQKTIKFLRSFLIAWTVPSTRSVEGRFSYSHLAQIKFILRDAIQIRRVLVFDERTSCMKPDLHISINVDAIEIDGKLKSESVNLHLRKIFRARLADFSKSHPEVDEIPQERLPEPFSRQKLDAQSNAIEAFGKQQLAVASHLPCSFREWFSKASLQPLVVPVPESPLNNRSSKEETAAPAPSPEDLLFEPASNRKSVAFSSSLASFPPSSLPATPCKESDASDNGNGSCTETAHLTPAKLAYTPARLMSLTPALHPPKRCYMSPEEDVLACQTNGKLEDEIGGQDCSVDNDIFDILPENLIQSIREKERKAIEERNPAISQAKRRQQMIACLPKLFNKIHFLFQLSRQSVITKEELIHKIIASHYDILDRREVEEQLNLLLELVPEWISRKLAFGGDFLFCINKRSSPESLRARLEEVK
ncbi:CDT1-like protein a, chloroplastic [Morella rubra]|uniref:CDT1-like protein a, chloroplastic n=1 Tax=Morella rubra TaxID=262757 RepID=A0A6A1VLT1_9ROSI|nr:CDT1-like protein a, chloroplastic [Morella rubra]